ncbi:hypothetical protein Slin15195_G100600 [Septoria linicola]|uniref:Uncharacterized protein n=1 Tax=Septoria linicola TaxID=215465 RepID=A0A9Q9B5K3_9PEZI|nr:hypothetical protein Slin15195_G100600 [Septoria linicola]
MTSKSATSATHGQNADTNIGTAIFNALLKPLQISVLDPAIMYVNIYTSYLYACYYTFFDGFPMVHHITYKLAYYVYILGVTPKKTTPDPEARLRPALIAVSAPPIGIFLFGWTAEPTSNAYWICDMLGLVIY